CWLVAWCVVAFLGARPASAQQESVASTLHNLSVSGPGEIRALSETEVCKFCHIPHNAVVPAPLWGHALSTAQYDVPQLRSGEQGLRPAPQPDGDSRLCLSCHDGTVALGDVASEPRPIAMAGGERLRPGRRGYLGTDLSGSHPISFVVPDGDLESAESDQDMGLQPLSVIRFDEQVRLDGQGKMQCTTCHDAHADRFYQPGRVPRFWVKPTVEEVCLTCHVPR
ncbi:MAG: cytochrome c3 family protein, partial [Planctomycetota bacterium]